MTLGIAATCSAADAETVERIVGTVAVKHAVERVEPQVRLTRTLENWPPDSPLLLQFLIADDVEGHHYALRIFANDQPIGERSGNTRGFGRRSFFFSRASDIADTTPVTITVENAASEPLFMESLRLIDPQHVATRSAANENFVLSFLTHISTETQKISRDQFRWLRDLEEAPGVQKAFGSEFHYARHSAEDLQAIAKEIRGRCDQIGWLYLPVVCSWWAGTPAEVFQRIDFQQICWSDTDNHDEGPELRELLGEKWDLRYGLTVPNMWSNTPWQTMNHPELNALRHERMTTAVKILEKELGGRLAGYVSENEPAYWAWEAADFYYPVRRQNLWADFNPYTVADARKDGVTLDPSQGLGLTERRWLHQNLARYMQANIDVLVSAGASGKVYSHSLLSQYFPMLGTGYYMPYADTARVNRAATGLETLWKTDMDGLWRVREWGRWACVNREENDGYAMEFHTAMLQAIYMMGAELFNSYNWSTINENGRAIRYFNDFLANLREGGVVESAKREGDATLRDVVECSGPVNVRPEFPWFDSIELTLQAAADADPLIIKVQTSGSDETVAFARLLPPVDGRIVTNFGDVAQVEQQTPLYISLSGKGWKAAAGEDGLNLRLLCNLKKQRARSQFLMNASEAERPGAVTRSE